MRYLYSALFYVLVPFLILRMLLRSRRAPDYRRRMGERFAIFSTEGLSPEKPKIWVHAVSVGETIAAAPVVEALLSEYPNHQLVITTTTPTGSERVRALFGQRVFHVYAPWDLPGATVRFIEAIQPSLLLLMETELWPNMIHHAARHGCPILLANARLSERSARGYGRIPGLTQSMLSKLSFVACQSAADRERFVDLGLAAERIRTTGSIKFDITLEDPLRGRAEELRAAYRADERFVLVAASTHPGEDEQILAAFTGVLEQYPQSLLVLVPRHPERFDAVCQQVSDAGFNVARRSAQVDPDVDINVVVGDTMGELVLLLSLSGVAIVGGSLVEHGGHNVLEAAAWGVPVVTGPHMFNFAEISELMVAAGAMIQLQDPQDLGQSLLDLLSEPARLEQMGRAGLEVIAANRGARQQLLEIVRDQLV